jgi:hypothetical protein
MIARARRRHGARERAGFAAAAFALCGFASDVAFAQTHAGDAAMAETLFNDARRMMTAGDYAGACPKLAESYRLDPGSGTLTALAVCHEGEGKTASAWAEFIEVISEARQAGRADREKFAQQHVDAVEPKLSKLTVVVDPLVASLAGLEVRRDGTVIGPAGWGTAAPVDPGAHTVEVKATGKKPWSTTVTLGPSSDLQTVSVAALEDAPAQGQAIASAPPGASSNEGAATGEASSGTPQPEQPPSSAGNTRRTLAFVVGGAGLVAAGVGTYFGLNAISKRHQASGVCPPPSTLCNSMDAVSANDDAKSAAVAADVAFGVALVAVGAAAVLYFTAPASAPPNNASTASLRIVPVASARGGSVVLSARW